MKYTRYDYRRKKGDKMSFVVMLLSIVLAAVLIGTLLSNMFLKSGNKTNSQTSGGEANTQQKRDKTSSNSYNFILVQAGYYGVENNAKMQKESLKAVGVPFMLEEEGKFRVFVGIFMESEYDSVKNKLDLQSIPNSKVTYVVDTSEKFNNFLVEIIKGHLQILNALSQSNAASVKTEEYKNWFEKEAAKLEKNGEKNNLIEEYKAYINSLPEEIDNSKVEEGYLFIYKVILKIGTKKAS